MPNTIYPNFGSLMLGDAGAVHVLPDLSVAGAESRLIDTGVYTYTTTHQDEDDITGVVGTFVALASPTVVDGVWDAATPITHTSVTGNTVEAVIFSYNAGGATSANPLIMFIDTDTGGAISITPNGGDIEIALGASIIDLIT
jgi:hypothetical protein